ncbi:MAG: SsrA-binding protein SmpB [Bacteroidales bacterium]|jgi:SsrA-binding protein|nr:SsrA-binding protein SmpB [Bacteroidales bacterium]
MEFQNNIQIKNKKAYFDYELVEKYIAGIVLTGTEIKSLRMGKASLVDTYCLFKDGELYVRGMNIAAYDYGTYNNHDPMRDRKLLLQKAELRKLLRKTKEKGFTIVPTRLFITEKGLAKLEIALARGKKEYDKRETIRERDLKRDMERNRIRKY